MYVQGTAGNGRVCVPELLPTPPPWMAFAQSSQAELVINPPIEPQRPGKMTRGAGGQFFDFHFFHFFFSFSFLFFFFLTANDPLPGCFPGAVGRATGFFSRASRTTRVFGFSTPRWPFRYSSPFLHIRALLYC